MNDDLKLIASIRACSGVAEPPARDAAYRGAMRAVPRPVRLGVRRALTALVAAASLALPAGVFQVVGTYDHAPDRVTPLVVPSVTPRPEASATPSTAGQDHRNETPGADPQPSRGADDEHGHKGSSGPGGPSVERSEGHAQSRQNRGRAMFARHF